jgi:L-ascorbate metabolism protein UlaG (beta-lactamase superfamily)
LIISGTFPVREIKHSFPLKRFLAFGLMFIVLNFVFALSAEAICKPGLVRRDGRFIPVSWNLDRQRLPLARLAKAGLTLGLRYMAHSSFLLTGPKGGRVLTDPYWTTPPNPLPQAVSVSNWHDTHSQTGPYEGKAKIFFGASPEGRPNKVDELIKGIRVFSFPQIVGNAESPYVINTVFIFQAAGICVAHLGNARFGPSEGQIRALGKIHVMLLPIDGRNNLTHEEGAKLVKRIGPNIVVPMHYAGPELSTMFAQAMKVEGFERVKLAKSPALNLSLRKLPPPTVLTILPPTEDVP